MEKISKRLLACLLAALMIVTAVPFMGVTAAAAHNSHNYIYAQGNISITKYSFSGKYNFSNETYKCDECNDVDSRSVHLQDKFNNAVADALKIVNTDAYKLDTAEYRAVKSAYEALIGLANGKHYEQFIQEKIDAMNSAVAAFNKVNKTDLLKEFTVTFKFRNADGEVATSTDVVRYGNAATAPTFGNNGFSKTYSDKDKHYNIDVNKNGTIKWDKDFTKVTSDMTVTVTYTGKNHNYTSVVKAKKDPTCTENGNTEARMCKDCGFVTGGEEIPALGHAWGTPTSNGFLSSFQTSKCTRKGCSATYVEHANGNHIKVSVKAKAPTCTQPGYEAYEYCRSSTCQWSTYKEIPALGHDIVKDAAKEATCSSEGLTEGQHCTRCKDPSVTVKQGKIAALSHDFSLKVMDGAHIKTVATCTEPATYFYACAACGQIAYNLAPFEGEALGHNYTKRTVKDIDASSATCTEPAKKYYTCTRCDTSAASASDKEDHTYTVGAALGHDWPKDSKKNDVWTDLGNGTEKRVCDRCNTTETLCKVAANGKRAHEFTTIDAVPATCTTDGYTTYFKCTKCDYTEGKRVIPAAHTASRTETSVLSLPTCLNEGVKEDVVYCTDVHCGKVISRETSPVAALGHDYTAFLPDGNGTTHTKICKREDCSAAVKDHSVTENHKLKDVAEKKATCTEDGYTAGKVCEVCGYTTTTVIKAAGQHDEEVIPGKAATCTEKGLTEGKKCKICGKTTVEQKEIPALGHKEEVIKGKEATCTEAGLTDGKKCTVCGETTVKQEEIKALGHDWENITAKEPTCTEKGTTAGKKCKRCGTVDAEAKELEPLGHDYQVTVPAKEATCTEDGCTEGKKCTRCGDEIKSEVIPNKGGHKEEVIPAKAATCTEDGNEEGKKCSVCGEVIVEAKIIPALGHAFETVTTKATTAKDGSIVKTCPVCNATETTPIAKVATIVLTKSKLAYNGKAQTPAVVVKDSEGVVFVKDADYTVTYANNVNTGKATVTVKFINSNYDVTKVLSFTIAPTATAKVAAASAAKTLKISWSAVTGASGYRVQLFNGNKCVRDKFTTKKAWKFTKLSKGTKYKVVVTPYVTVGETNVYGAAKALNTSTSPAMPQNVKAAGGKKYIAVKWNAVNGATGYTVYYKLGKNGNFKSVTVSAKKNKVAIKKLASGKTYYVKVTANKRVGSNVARSIPSKLQSVTVK